MEPRRERPWYQFHLWHLFVLTTLFAVVCSVFAVHPVLGAVVLVLSTVVVADIGERWLRRRGFAPFLDACFYLVLCLVLLLVALGLLLPAVRS